MTTKATKVGAQSKDGAHYVTLTDGAGNLVAIGSGGAGTVTSTSVVTANGVSATTANPTTTPAMTFSLGAITPTSVNGVNLTTSYSGPITTASLSGKTITVVNGIITGFA